MATLTMRGNTFTPRLPSVSIVGQVNAEQVTFAADESWSGLELQAQFSNSSIDREPVPVALDETMTCFVPSEATAQPGKVYVALAGYDDGVQIKLTEMLHYSNAKTGADPSGGIPPEEQTPSYLNQITQILNETKAVAQSVRDDADQGKFDGEPGKNGEPGKSPKEEGGTWWLWNEEKQKWIDTGILAAGKNGISPKVATQPVTGGTRVVITDADGEKSFDVLNGKNGNPGKNGETPNITIGKVDTLPSDSKATAEITGQTPNLTLNMGIPQGPEGPAGLGLPTPTPEDAGKVPMVNPEGNGYIFGEAGGGKIDDTTLGRDTTWSSLKIVDSLAPAFDASGSVVTCNPVPGYPLSVVSQISAVQSGTGDPSPDNVRPVKGWDEANLWIVGKNLFNISGDINRNYLGEPGRNYNLVDEGVLTANVNSSGGHLVGQVVNVKKGTPVIFSFDMLDAGTGIGGYVGIYEIGIASMRSSVQPKTPGHYVSREYIPESDIILLAFGTAAGTGAKYKNISLYFKSEGGEYEPYNGSTYIAPFEDTVYGGQLNWTTGTLMVDRVCLSLTGEETFVNATASDDITRFYILKNLNPAAMGMFDPGGTGEIYSMVGNKSPYDNADENIAQIASLGNVNELRIRLSLDLDDAEKFKAELARLNKAGTPFQVCYKIAEPFAIHLTPTEILALSGVNTLYTDTGDITVSGRADPNEVIKGLEDRIAALQGGGGGTMDAQQVLLSRALAATCTTFSDSQALSVPDILPTWQEFLDSGREIPSGVCVMHDGQCYRQAQSAPIKPEAHRPQGSPGMSAVYRPVVPGHTGTLDDPIPWVYEMDCFKDKYYSNEGKVYLCKQDMTPCVWAPGTAGVWQWEVVS